jgi:ATP-dependent DNA helicase RecG
LEFPFLSGLTTPKTAPKTARERILLEVANNPNATREELAKKMRISTNGVKYHTKKMNAEGILKFVGSTKKGHWEILKN